jgi:tryptophan-rich sensory protein
MTGIASRGQLRMSFARTAMIVVPAVLLLGSMSGWLSNSSSDNGWYQALAKPDFTPPGGYFAAAWTVLYVLMGVALAIVIYARGAAGRGLAVGAFVVQFALNLAWSPTFFGAHRVGAAFWLIVAMLVAAAVTAYLFWRVRPRAGWLLAPYLLWLGFAALLNYEIWRLNPDAKEAIPRANSAEIAI